MSTSVVTKFLRECHRVHEGAATLSGVLTARLSRRKINESSGAKRLTLVHFGDYAEGFRRLASGGPETYYAQRYTVDFIGSLVTSNAVGSVTSVSLSDDLYETLLPNGVNALGVKLYPPGGIARHSELVEAVRRTSPTHLIVMSVSLPLIVWGIQKQIPVLPMLADSFRDTGPKAKLKYKLLTLLLNSPSIELVANHNLAASLDLERIGVDPRKIVPFDWPALISPRDYAAKKAPLSGRTFRMLYVGSLIESKGVGDAIVALANLVERGRNVGLTIIGQGEIEKFKEIVTAHRVESHVTFLGRRGHNDVLSAMRDHDAVLVPSRWSYPEGLPMTLYEALCVRTPLITSDHPMFALKIRDLQNALVFREKDIASLVDCIDKLISTPELYESLSQAAGKAAEGYLCPLKYDQLISGFIDSKNRNKLREFSLTNYDYAHSMQV